MNRRFAASRFCRDASLPDDLQGFLRKAGLRSTRQRVAVARLLLRDANRRVNAEILYDEAREARCPVSRSAVCNALRQFEQAGLLRRIAIDRSKQSWFVIANAAHRSLDKDAPIVRPVQRTGVINSRAILGGLHHHYARV